MDHTWVRELSAGSPEDGVTSLGTRHRASAVIGESATAWAVTAGRRMADYILETLVDWPGDHSDGEAEALRRATEASTLDTLTALVAGDRNVLAQSAEPLQNVSYYVRHGIPLDEVVRNVHAGQEFLTQELLGCVEALVPAESRMRVVQEMTRVVIESWSLFARNISVQYADEYERWSRSRDGVTARLIRSIINGVRVDPAEAARELEHELDQSHAGLVLWLAGVDVDSARAFDFGAVAREIAAVSLSGQHPLVVMRGFSQADVWLGSPDAAVAGRLRDHGAWPSPLRIAVGRPGSGLSGFRSTHQEAKAAQHVARLSRTRNAVTAYEDVRLVSLLAADTERAGAFVRSVLGPLNAQDERTVELRRTLAAHIDANGSIALTSRALHTHRNTVTYRLRQIDQLLGENRNNTELRCALELAACLPSAVLAPPHP
ncbi:PucR family transcriptional regulator [Streptomyces sp. NBC_01089]|uniref:PucR family transcriptional regulator n=1 Tax=Streptomyces sp. NBC_01089 TaxID=2903747 RepID=UPI0038690AE8|nr:helix-turn-helix domain-containing protein [Streptomyces sp. NBC_01089]